MNMEEFAALLVEALREEAEFVKRSEDEASWLIEQSLNNVADSIEKNLNQLKNVR